MMDLETSGRLDPEIVWRYFRRIASIAHPSGHEDKLRDFLAGEGVKLGLLPETDPAGNLLLKPAKVPLRMLFQAHMDMVPQKRADVTFDFLHDPISLVRDGEWVSSGGRTTIGGDDGIGIALAMSLFAEGAAPAGAGMLFTVEEETGLTGAGNLNVDFLRGVEQLINLDSCDPDAIVIGCAGGCHIDAKRSMRYTTPAADAIAFHLAIGGLKGGHSGEDIADCRGNSIRILADFLKKYDQAAIASFSGGTLDNVIPASAEAVCVVKNDAVFAEIAADASHRNGANFHGAENFFFRVQRLTALPEKVWSSDCRAEVLNALCLCPNEVLEFSEEFQMPVLSNNLAAVREENQWLHVSMLARGNEDRKKTQLSEEILRLFRADGFSAEIASSYPGWTPKSESPLIETARQIYRELRGKTLELQVIHAGLECGFFAGMAPQMAILSAGPRMENLHTPEERIQIASVETFYQFLKELCRVL
ncbi:MAG: beta-Ala-His dipeptidase [Victivallaceae bacterium]|nr:beta-Ala-His dipeptidase [Victivallaceae bacterium]